MRTTILLFGVAFLVATSSAFALLSMKTDSGAAIAAAATATTGRRAFFAKTSLTVATAAILTASGVGQSPQIATAATPEVKTTESGKIKYAILKPAQNSNDSLPQKGDIVAIEYTGYLTSGQIFDGTHAEGKKNILVFTVGDSNAVIDGMNEMVLEMRVGEKVQAIIPAELAFKDKGVCLPKGGECLIKPGDTLVYDIALKRVAIPPP
jgi:FKBP-type peptidyl-prolyl cis-trans isomerase